MKENPSDTVETVSSPPPELSCFLFTLHVKGPAYLAGMIYGRKYVYHLLIPVVTLI